MKYIYLIIFCCFFSQNSLLAQAPAARLVPKTKELPTGDVALEQVEQFCGMVKANLERDMENYSKITYAKYNSYRKTLISWMNYSFLELDSNIDIQWFSKILEYLNFYYNTKREHDLSVASEDSEKKVINKKRFEAATQNFKKFLEREPPKPPEQRLEILKRQKQEYLQAKRAAEREKSGNTRKLFDDDKK